MMPTTLRGFYPSFQPKAFRSAQYPHSAMTLRFGHTDEPHEHTDACDHPPPKPGDKYENWLKRKTVNFLGWFPKFFSGILDDVKRFANFLKGKFKKAPPHHKE